MNKEVLPWEVIQYLNENQTRDCQEWCSMFGAGIEFGLIQRESQSNVFGDSWITREIIKILTIEEINEEFKKQYKLVAMNAKGERV